jgi:hypothetical protein
MLVPIKLEVRRLMKELWSCKNVFYLSLLQFGDEQIFWQCLQVDACEGQPHGNIYDPVLRSTSARPEEISLRRLVKEIKAGTVPGESGDGETSPFGKLWQWLARTYSGHGLTRTSDKLVALSGLVDILQQTSGDQYLAGLWRSHLPAALLWHRTFDPGR